MTVDPKLYRIIQEIESSNNPNAVSSKGARGLMQIMPDTGRKPGYGVTPLRNQFPEENVRFGKDYFNAMYKKFGSIPLALAAYNAGPGAVEKVNGDISKLPKETQKYVSKAMNRFDSKSRSLTGNKIMAEKKLTPQQRMRNTVRGDRLEKLMEEQNIRSDSPKGKEMQANLVSLASMGIGLGPAVGLIRAAYMGGSAAMRASGRAALQKALGQAKKVGNSEKATYVAPVGKGKTSTFLSKAEKAAGMKARKSAITGTAGAATIQTLKDKPEDMSKFRPSSKPKPPTSNSKPISVERKPAPVEEGKPGMTRAEAEAKGIAKPEGGFFQDVADLIAGGKGKGTVEYDYPDDDVDKKRGGMVYRMKGGKVGKATKRGTGKAMSGAYINYGKPMKEKMSSGGKVGMRGCGKALRGYGKAMKGK